MNIVWLSDPEWHDYPAAEDYLALIVSGSAAMALRMRLEAESVEQFKAKDVLRATGMLLERLKADNRHVAKNKKKIDDGTPLSPILLVRGNQVGLPHLVVADGWHRLCAVYDADEDAEIPCKIV